MDQVTLCIFANFFIDNEERFRRLKDSFYSFRDVEPNEWRINIRGRFKHEVYDFLHSELGDIIDVRFLESEKGWLHDSYSFMHSVRSEFVFFWIEDHICIVDPKILSEIIYDMSLASADQCLYSWYHPATLNVYRNLPKQKVFPNIISYKLDSDISRIARHKLGADFYCVSALSIFSSKFFLKVLSSKRPYLKRWPKHLPFDFEKKSTDCVAPSIVCALPTRELFAAIDDDHGNPGYSLIARGEYPDRVSRDELKVLEFGARRARSRFQFMPRLLRSFLVNAYSLSRRLYYSLSYYV